MDYILIFQYTLLDNTGVGATVGAENADETDGSIYFFNGAGTDVHVNTLAGGDATFCFQIEANCSVDPITNDRTLPTVVPTSVRLRQRTTNKHSQVVIQDGKIALIFSSGMNGR